MEELGRLEGGEERHNLNGQDSGSAVSTTWTDRDERSASLEREGESQGDMGHTPTVEIAVKRIPQGNIAEAFETVDWRGLRVRLEKPSKHRKHDSPSFLK